MEGENGSAVRAENGREQLGVLASAAPSVALFDEMLTLVCLPRAAFSRWVGTVRGRAEWFLRSTHGTGDRLVC